MDLRQTKEYGNYMAQEGWEVEKISGVQIFIKRMPLVPFSVAKLQRPDKKIDWEKVEKLKRERRVFYSVFEPTEKRNIPAGYMLSKSPYLPSTTIEINLKKSKEVLFGELKKDARSFIKKSEVKVKKIGLSDFWEKWGESKKGHRPSSSSFKNLIDSFGDRAFVRVAELRGEVVAGIVSLRSSDTAYYYFGWTGENGRKNGAQYVLVWEAIMWGKKNGCKVFDMEGVDDKRWPRKSWEGFSGFKKKFGGKIISYPGCYQKWL